MKNLDFQLKTLLGIPLILSLGYSVPRLLNFVPDFATRNFVDGIAGGILATMLGLAAGVPIAVGLAARQQREQQEITAKEQKEQQKQEEKKKLEGDKQWLAFVMERISHEISNNKQILERLKTAIEASPISSEEHWLWIASIVDSLEMAAHNELVSSNLKRNLPFEVAFYIDEAYSLSKGLQHRVHQGL
jgi:hypothetical protein